MLLDFKEQLLPKVMSWFINYSGTLLILALKSSGSREKWSLILDTITAVVVQQSL